MLSLTRKSDYALVALAYLGKNRQEMRTPVSARHIAELFGLPLPLLMNILKELSQARLLDSTRGVRGGYTLAADPADITLLEIVTAIEGPLQFAQCTDGLPVIGQGCTIADGCPIRGPVRKLHQRIQGFLEQTTLQDLLDDYDVDAEQHGCRMAEAASTGSDQASGNGNGNGHSDVRGRPLDATARRSGHADKDWDQQGVGAS